LYLRAGSIGGITVGQVCRKSWSLFSLTLMGLTLHLNKKPDAETKTLEIQIASGCGASRTMYFLKLDNYQRVGG